MGLPYTCQAKVPFHFTPFAGLSGPFLKGQYLIYHFASMVT